MGLRPFKEFDKVWLKKWIESIAPKISKDMSFDEWLSQYGCDKRYDSKTKKYLKKCWKEALST